MNKYVLKATALAIGALVGGSAVAAVTAPIDFDAATPAVPKFAQELAYVTATPLTGGYTRNGAGPAGTSAMSFQTKLGFGVSNGQTRYLRVDYGNAKLAVAHQAVIGADIDVSGTVALVQGGAVGDSYAVYQMTATGDLPASSLVKLLVPTLVVTSNNAPVTASFSLHETATSAQGATPSNSGLLYSKTNSIASFAASYEFDVTTTGDNTALVEQSFKKFSDGATPPAAVTTRSLGAVRVRAANGVLDNTGTQMTLAKLTQVAAGKTTLTVTGDFAASTDNGATPPVLNGLRLKTTDCTAGGATATVNGTKTSATFDLGVIINANAADFAAAANVPYLVCYDVTGTTAITEQTNGVSLAFTPTAAAAPLGASSVANPAAKTLGAIKRDGTELTAAFTTINPDYLSRIVLTSSHTSDAAVVVTPILASGGSCGAGTTNFSLPAGKQLFIDVGTVCPSITGLAAGADTRLGLKVTVAAPKSKIEGVMNILKKATATASSSDLNSYSLTRPAN